MTARAVMVLGTTSGAGKSWLATALCRWYGRLGEIGSAQYFQALAARAAPEVRMNPVLRKPENDSSSQVVVMGRVRADLAGVPWRERSARLWPFARDAPDALMTENDVVVIEGAGSPAEINVHTSDDVNMRTALHAKAACLLVTDIDRGGAFAHLFGTHPLLPAEERALIRGFVLNRFRGDASLLAPGPQQLHQLTGVPTLAVLPMWRGQSLPEEDGVFDDRATGARGGIQVAVIAFPQISKLDEFEPLRQCCGVSWRWARTPAELAGADWIVLPGSKHTGGEGRGLALLPIDTRFEPEKTLRRTPVRFDAPDGDWARLAGLAFDGCEIRCGRTEAEAGVAIVLRNDEGSPIGWQRGPVLGLYAHGLFESADAMRALFGAEVRPLDAVFDGPADFIDARFEPASLLRLIQGQE